MIVFRKLRNLVKSRNRKFFPMRLAQIFNYLQARLQVIHALERLIHLIHLHEFRSLTDLAQIPIGCGQTRTVLILRLAGRAALLPSGVCLLRLNHHHGARVKRLNDRIVDLFECLAHRFK
jgi:hypothetical protein